MAQLRNALGDGVELEVHHQRLFRVCVCVYVCPCLVHWNFLLQAGRPTYLEGEEAPPFGLEALEEGVAGEEGPLVLDGRLPRRVLLGAGADGHVADAEVMFD